LLVESVARLIAELAEARVNGERRADQLVGLGERVATLERENGRLTAELVGERLKSSLLASTSPHAVETASEPLTARFRVRASWLLLIVILLLALTFGQPAWVR
jgi:hypothetical protein